MPKKPKGQKPKVEKETERPSANAISRWENEGGATKRPPRELPQDPVSRAVHTVRATTERDVGDTADKIMRAPKKRR